jgi:hypothetical protein
MLGLDRGDLANVDGFFAILLWRDYQTRNNPQALETLLAYNIRDVVNLESLLIKAHNLKAARTPFAAAVALHETPPPAEPFTAHRPTIDRLLRQYASFGS